MAVRRRPAFASAAALAAAAALAVTGLSRTSGAAVGDRLIGATPPGMQVTAVVVLRLRQRALDRFLQGLVNPRSPNYEQYGTAASFGRRFGLAGGELARLRRALRRDGLDVIGGYPQRTALRISGTAGDLRRAFGVVLDDWVTATGVRYHAPRHPVTLGAPFSRWATGIADLNTRPRAVPVDVPSTTPGGLMGPDALSPDAAARAYDLLPLVKAGFDGTGQTIAIVSFDKFVDSDIRSFDTHFARSGPAPRHVDVAGGTAVGPGHDETDLDVQVIRGVVPKAQILDYEAPSSTRHPPKSSRPLRRRERTLRSSRTSIQRQPRRASQPSAWSRPSIEG